MLVVVRYRLWVTSGLPIAPLQVVRGLRTMDVPTKKGWRPQACTHRTKPSSQTCRRPIGSPTGRTLQLDISARMHGVAAPHCLASAWTFHELSCDGSLTMHKWICTDPKLECDWLPTNDMHERENVAPVASFPSLVPTMHIPVSRRREFSR